MLNKCRQLQQIFPNYKEDRRYIEYKNRMYDITMSCDYYEVLQQMTIFMNSASKNNDVFAMLAAYDIYCDVKANHEN